MSKKTEIDYDVLYKLYVIDNLSQRDVAKVLDTTRWGVISSLKKYGITKSSEAAIARMVDNARTTRYEKYGQYNPNDWYEKNKITRFSRYGTYSPKERYEKSKATRIDRYGSYFSNDMVIKSKKTRLEKYGDENYNNKEKSKSTRYDKYGCYESDGRIINIAKTKLNRYGDPWYCDRKKAAETMHKNGTDSSEEYDAYIILCNKYGEGDVKRQYYDNRYPYPCDFYIPSHDLFIECNFHWTHGGCAYDRSSLHCMVQLGRWKIKSKKSDYFSKAIRTWTERDSEKVECAKKNNLNFVVYYSIKEM